MLCFGSQPLPEPSLASAPRHRREYAEPTQKLMGNVQGDAALEDPVLADFLQAVRERQGHASMAGGEAPAPGVNPGDRVLIHGLTQRAELNGQFAVVLYPEPISKRFHLRVEDTGSEIRARPENFTKVKVAPSEVVEVDKEGGAVDMSTLLQGDCTVCLGEKQATRCVVPCGHIAVCDACAPRLRMTHGRCPICRGPIYDFVRVFMPGGDHAEELEKAIARCKKAEKRANELEACLQKREKRKRLTGSSNNLKAEPYLGCWAQLPLLTSRNASLLLSPNDVEYSKQYGEVVLVRGSICALRFKGADPKVYEEQGLKEPGPDDHYKDVDFPIDFPFKAVLTPEEAQRVICTEDKYCVFASMKEGRKKKLQSELRADRKRLKAASEPLSKIDVS